MKRSLVLCCCFSLALLLVSCGGGGGGFFISPANSPTVKSTSPATGATGVPITTTAITATFDRDMDAATFTTATFTVRDGANNPVTGTVSLAGATATFTPSTILAAATTYTAVITSGVKDMAGTPLAGNFIWSFTTTSVATRPTVTTTVPAKDAVNIAATTAVITINFSEAMDPASINPATVMVTDNLGNPLTGTVSLATATSATFTPAAYLAYSTTYTITVTTGVRNQAGNTMAATYTGIFTTLPGFGSWVATAITGAPPMSGHSAVWTGTEMIVFDGTGGARYNPANNSWTLIADFAAATQLPPRIGFTAVWTGTAMIIWGGYDPVARAAVNSGAVFTPGAAGTAGTWAELTTPPPTFAGRYNHTAVWTGTEMIIWGGFDPGTGTFYNDGARFSPGNNNWYNVSTAGAPVARRGHAAVWTGTQMIVWGGVNAAGTFLNNGAAYTSPGDGVPDPGTPWTPVATTNAPAPTSAGPFNAVWSITTNEMLIWGLTFSGRYNPAGAGSWSAITSNSATPPVVGTAVWTGSLMVVWGNGIGGRYDPALDTWTAVASAGAPSPRTGHTAVWSGTEMIIYGGAGAPGTTILNTGGRYTPL